MPDMPTRENGAKLDRFFNKQSGSKAVVVIPNKDAVRDTSHPVAVINNDLVVSAKIME